MFKRFCPRCVIKHVWRTYRSFAFLYRRVFWRSDTEGLRFALAIASILWSSLMSSDLASAGSNPGYAILRMFATDATWAFAFAVYGVLASYVLFTRNYLRCLDVVVSIGGCFLWMTSMLSMLFVNVPPPASAASEIVLALSSLWILVRVIVDRDRRFEWRDVE